ncbi:synembryn [Cephus cinctus]|uniref:Synembryn n=1 Tax=Cephus cinctus TaxID=211228 RepID=A0AAJ7FKZ1_CEPCN|nr:synembryn [Cephus cinctus]
MNDLLKELPSCPEAKKCEILNQFLIKYALTLKFDELNENGQRQAIWESLFDILETPEISAIHDLSLAALRILSRDKTDLENLITHKRINIVLDNAALGEHNSEQIKETKVITEALKLLCNLLFNSEKVQKLIVSTTAIPHVINRLNNYDKNISHEIRLFDTRILFLITALNVPTRNFVRERLHGDECLEKHLKKIILEAGNNLNETQTVLACEILKVLFNLHIKESTDNEKEKLEELVTMLRQLFLSGSAMAEELQSNIINLLTALPYSSYGPFAPDVDEPNADGSEVVYRKKDMTAMAKLLKFLDSRLEAESNLVEKLSPTMTALLRLVKSNRLIRKYTRLQVLPPLKDVMKRPEEGKSLRAKLCKLLTSPLNEVRDLVAEFVFVLCKEDVGRMVKYTGYGNAAGMFANKGLLHQRQPDTNYSSDSEDSETEEYAKYKEQINPVTGCYEKPKPNPLEGMSEEQKEYEAMQLAGLMDKLTSEGLVQPCRIDADGKPKPIEHVLELQNELMRGKNLQQDSDSD